MKSMTGFGAARARCGGVELSVEVRSVNQRHLDIKIAVPREYARWEADLRRLVSGEIGRGRVEVFVNRSVGTAAREVVVQRDVAAAYVAAWRKLQREFGLAGEVDLALLQGRGEIFQWADKNANPDDEVSTLTRILSKALCVHARSRKKEGTHLRRDMEARVRKLVELVRQIGRRTKKIGPELKQRLESRITALLDGRPMDGSRLAQEVAIISDRGDVTEELVRLRSHLSSLKSLLAESGQVGKRIDFLLQELNREFNTIGSKSGDLEVTNWVIDGKAELEKLREQVQNVE